MAEELKHFSLLKQLQQYQKNKVPLALLASSAHVRECIEDSTCNLGEGSDIYAPATYGDVVFAVKHVKSDEVYSLKGQKFLEIRSELIKKFPKGVLEHSSWWIRRPGSDKSVKSFGIDINLLEDDVIPSLPGVFLASGSKASPLPFTFLTVKRASLNAGIDVQMTCDEMCDLLALDLSVSKAVINLEGKLVAAARNLKSLKIPFVGEKDVSWLSKLKCVEVLRTNVKHASVLQAVGQLSSLRILDLGVTAQVEKNATWSLSKSIESLKQITFKGAFFQNIGVLKGASKLTSLSLVGCDIKEVSLLTECKHLAKLEVQNCGLLVSIEVLFTDESPILESLKELDFTFCGICNISGIGKCKNLETLRLAQCRKVLSLSPLANNTSIRKLTLIGVGATDWGVLKTLSGVDDLFFGSPELKSLSSIEEMTGLVSLTVSASPITDVAALANMRKLRKLSLASCGKLTSVEDLKNCIELRELDLSTTPIADLSGVGGCVSLEKLRLNFCRKLVSLAPLAGLNHLKEIYAMRSGVTSLNGLRNCFGLQVLELTQSKDLASIDGIAFSKSLQRLLLGDCALLTDISVLGTCKSLQFLNIVNCNAIKNIEVLSQLPLLTQVAGRSEFRRQV